MFHLLLVLLLTTITHIEARESKFFSKATRDTILEAPIFAPAPAPAPAVSGEGYGLYGHVSENDQSSHDAKTGNFGEEEIKYPYTYNKGYKNNYNENDFYGYKSSNNYNKYGNDGYAYENYYRGYNGNSESDGYVNEKLGRSDTSKYYNNFENLGNYDNGYGTERGISGKSEGYYGNSENHEFDTMEEYESTP